MQKKVNLLILLYKLSLVVQVYNLLIIVCIDFLVLVQNGQIIEIIGDYECVTCHRIFPTDDVCQIYYFKIIMKLSL